MNDRTLMVYIGTAEDALQDFLDVWKSGQAAHPVNRLSFDSMAGFSRTLTPKRWELLTALKKQGGQNINQLSKHLKRNDKNVHTDVQTMLELGLIEKDFGGNIFVPWDEIETYFKLTPYR